MKKTLLTLVALLLAVAMCFAFVGCSKDDDKDDKKDDDKKTSVSDKADKNDKTDKEPAAEEEEEEEEDIPVVENTADTEGMVADFFEAVYIDFDADKAFADVHEAVLEVTAETEGMTVDEFCENFQTSLDQIAEMGVVITYDITGTTDVDADTVASEYAELDLEVEDVMAYEVALEADVDGETSNTTAVITLVMIDGEWYIDPANSDI